MKAWRCLQGIRNEALGGKDLPTRIKILNWGANPAEGGDVVVNDVTAKAIEQQIADKTYADIVIDFEHSSVPGSPNYQQDPRKHAGIGRLEVVPGDGIYVTDIKWTPSGREFAREYPDISPAVRLDKDGRTVVFIHSVALCTHGALHDVTFFSSGDQECDHLAPDGSFVGGFEGCVEHFVECEGMPEERARRLCAYIGRRAGKIAGAKKEEAMELEERVKKLEAAIEELKATGGAVAEIKTYAARQDEADKAIKAMTADLALARGEIAKLQADLIQRDKEAVLAEAARAGKVVPLSAEQVKKMDLAMLRELTAKLPVTVPVDRRTPGNVQVPGSDMDGALEMVARRCGMDPAKVRETAKQVR